MKRLFSSRSVAAAALVLGGFAAVSAHARSDVQFSIGVAVPGVYVQPAPVYVQPRPVYVQPQPVYVQPQPVYVQPQPIYYGQYGYEGHRYGWRHRHHGDRFGPYGDFDRDGVPNRYDRAPDNTYRR